MKSFEEYGERFLQSIDNSEAFEKRRDRLHQKYQRREKQQQVKEEEKRTVKVQETREYHKENSRQGPEIIRFIDPMSTGSGGARSVDKRNPPPQPQGEKKLTKKEDYEQTQRHIELLATSSLTGNARKLHLQNRLTQLGLPAPKRKPTDLPRVPMKMAMDMLKAAKQRAKSTKQNLQAMGSDVVISTSDRHQPTHSMASTETGTVHNYEWTSRSHPMISAFDRRTRKEMRKKALGVPTRKATDRGLRIDTGSFRDGVLHVSKREISDITSSGTRPSRGRSRGGSRGASRGSSRGRGTSRGKR